MPDADGTDFSDPDWDPALVAPGDTRWDDPDARLGWYV